MIPWLTSLDQFSQTKKHFIFDFDGTLVHLDLPWSTEWDPRFIYLANQFHIFMPQPLPPGWDIVNQAVRKSNNVLIPYLRQLQNNFESKYLNGYTLNQPLIDWLIHHSPNSTFSIWTAQARTTIITILEKHHLTHYFSTILSRDDLTYIKPDPEGFVTINQNHEPLSDFLMIGDTGTDEEASKNAGIDFLRVSIPE